MIECYNDIKLYLQYGNTHYEKCPIDLVKIKAIRLYSNM